MDYIALKTELTTDPKGLGYAANLATTNDIANAALYNSTTGPGAQVLTLPSLTHDEFAMLIAPVVMALSTATTALQAQWTPMLQLIGGVQTVVLNTQTLGIINALSADFSTQLPDSAVTAATTKMCSRCEVQNGVGVVAQWQDIAKATGRL